MIRWTIGDSAFGWMLSTALHVALLLGATLIVLDQCLSFGAGGSDFDVVFGEPRLRIDRLDSIVDRPAPRPPVSDRAAPLEDAEALVDFDPEPVTVITVEEGKVILNCGSHSNGCCRNFRYVYVPRRPRFVRGTYTERIASAANNRRGTPRLKIPEGCRAVHLLGLEVFCRCPRISPLTDSPD